MLSVGERGKKTNDDDKKVKVIVKYKIMEILNYNLKISMNSLASSIRSRVYPGFLSFLFLLLF